MTKIVQMKSSGLHEVARIRHVLKSKDGEERDYHTVSLPGTSIVLIFFENKSYDESVEAVSNGDTTHYKSLSSIPKYVVHKNNKKVSSALPRIDIHDSPFLFIPKGHARMGIKNGNILQKNYYVFNLDEDYHLTKASSLWFNIRGRTHY